jgi:hypothetical protein
VSKDHTGSLPSGGSDDDAVLVNLRGYETARRGPADDTALIGRAVREQLARDIAEIESASAALRKAEPALETWTGAPPAPTRNARPVWLLIALLWLSTALLTVGALAAIAALIG